MRLSHKKRAELVANLLATERKFRQQVLIEQPPLQMRMLATLRGNAQKGIDETGKTQKTKAPGTFNVRIEERVLKKGISYPYKVTMGFRRDNMESIDALGLKEMEKQVKKGIRPPKKTVFFVTDIFHALRSCKHLREGYQKELDEKDAFLADVEKLNAHLSELHRRGGITCAELRTVLEEIAGPGGFAEKTKGWKNFDKRLARDYLQAAVDLLEKAVLAGSALERNRNVVGACAKLTAFRNRLGVWRDREIGQLLAWNYLREWSIRALRDDYLKTLIRHYLDVLKDDRVRFAAVRTWKSDMYRREILSKIKDAMEQKKDYLEIRALTVELYKFSRGTRIENRVVSIGRLLKEDLEAAKAGMNNLDVFLRVRNPFYVIEELEKTADPYLAEFSRLFRFAVERMRRNDVWRALSYFQAAKKELTRA